MKENIYIQTHTHNKLKHKHIPAYKQFDVGICKGKRCQSECITRYMQCVWTNPSTQWIEWIKRRAKKKQKKSWISFVCECDRQKAKAFCRNIHNHSSHCSGMKQFLYVSCRRRSHKANKKSVKWKNEWKIVWCCIYFTRILNAIHFLFCSILATRWFFVWSHIMHVKHQPYIHSHVYMCTGTEICAHTFTFTCFQTTHSHAK